MLLLLSKSVCKVKVRANKFIKNSGQFDDKNLDVVVK